MTMTQDQPEPFLMTLHEAAQRIGRGVDQLDVEDAIDAGRLRAVALPGSPAIIRVLTEDVDRVGPSILHDDRTGDEPSYIGHIVEELRDLGWTVTPPAARSEACARCGATDAHMCPGLRPSWLVDREEDEGVEGLRIVGGGRDD